MKEGLGILIGQDMSMRVDGVEKVNKSAKEKLTFFLLSLMNL